MRVFGFRVNVKRLAILGGMIFLASCGSDSSNSDPVHIKMEFQDDAVSSFIQRSGIAYNRSILDNISETFIAQAHATTNGEISCMSGDQVTFDVEVLGKPLEINTTCGRSIEADIRRQLLFAFSEMTLFTDKDGHRVLDLRDADSEGTFWGIAHGKVFSGAPITCYDSFTFIKSTGEMIIDLDEDHTTSEGGVPNDCYAREAESDNNYCGTGNSTIDSSIHGPACKSYYRQSLTFRFKNGLFEYGPNQAALDAGYGDSEYNWFCQANNSDPALANNCLNPAFDPRP